ncbi:MAG: hypothetical protein IPK26_07500 [Planctomycetes bacterium]|nr:hypothetical protein [Planctomycetota bacterium]
MNDDRDLQGLLHAVDAAAPPPPGAPITFARLQALHARRRRRTLLLATAATALLGLAFALFRSPPAATLPLAASADERAGLQAELDRIGTMLASIPPYDPEPLARAQLALARGQAALDHLAALRAPAVPEPAAESLHKEK